MGKKDRSSSKAENAIRRHPHVKLRYIDGIEHIVILKDGVIGLKMWGHIDYLRAFDGTPLHYADDQEFRRI